MKRRPLTDGEKFTALLAACCITGFVLSVGIVAFVHHLRT